MNYKSKISLLTPGRKEKCSDVRSYAMCPKVVQVIPQEDYKVYVYFEDGKIVCYDVSELLDKKAFEPLRDLEFYMNSCTILNDTLAWDVAGNRDVSKCLDIDPDTLYELENVKEKIA